MQIKAKTVVITGAARGIGRALAVRFASQGANIALLDLDAADLESATQQCNALGIHAIAYAVDVSREENVSATLDQVVRDFGALDVLVNNAGIVKDAMLLKVKDGVVVGKMTLQQWQTVIDVNLTGVFLCAREAAQRMVKLTGAASSLISPAFPGTATPVRRTIPRPNRAWLR
jgi:3-oxoacyl-[acyl-carrier protein] reductase